MILNVCILKMTQRTNSYVRSYFQIIEAGDSKVGSFVPSNSDHSDGPFKAIVFHHFSLKRHYNWLLWVFSLCCPQLQLFHLDHTESNSLMAQGFVSRVMFNIYLRETHSSSFNTVAHIYLMALILTIR